MENFHPLHWMPSHADALNLKHHCAEFEQDWAELGAEEIVPKLLGSPWKKYFVVLFSSYLEIF